MLKTRVNNPNRVFISSNDDNSIGGSTNNQNGMYNQFTVRLQTPILNAKKSQLLRCSIPNIPATGVNIPDYALVFSYTVNTGATVYTRCIRLMPSNWVPPLVGNVLASMPTNRYFTDPSDLVIALNQAAANDSATFNPSFVANDVSFSYNNTTKVISMTGANSGYTYYPNGWADTNLFNFTGGAPTVPVYAYNGTTNTTTYTQPTLAQYPLNLRLGFTLPNATPNNGTSQYSNVGGVATIFNSFPNLVYTQSIALYADYVAGNTLTSSNKHNLLTCISVNAGPFGVIQHMVVTNNYLTKIPTDLYEITLAMFDDNNQPFYLPDNAIVNVELGFKYTDHDD